MALVVPCHGFRIVVQTVLQCGTKTNLESGRVRYQNQPNPMPLHVAPLAGLHFYDLSHPWGLRIPNGPYFEDVEIERVHCHGKSSVLSRKITARWKRRSRRSVAEEASSG
jgi:hypothetical protein